jgi:hypothetical protein
MYWKDKAGKIHLITEMSKDYLVNCKKILERPDIRIETLSKPSMDYSEDHTVQLCKDDFHFITEYDYTSSIEYYNICTELSRREQ